MLRLEVRGEEDRFGEDAGAVGFVVRVGFGVGEAVGEGGGVGEEGGAVEGGGAEDGGGVGGEGEEEEGGEVHCWWWLGVETVVWRAVVGDGVGCGYMGPARV